MLHAQTSHLDERMVKNMNQNEKKASYRVLLVITTPKLSDKATKLFNESGLPVHYKLNAVGTASNEMLEILGLGTPDKSVLITVLPKDFADTTMRNLGRELLFAVPGNGIAATMPVSGASSLMLKMLSSLEDSNTNESVRKDEASMSEIKYVMITAVVNQGYSEEVMNAAREAGAGGGTIIHGRRDGNEEALSIWGLGLQEEKDIVMIVADSEHKLEIMQSICDKCGIHSEAKGIVVSLPIDSVTGLGN